MADVKSCSSEDMNQYPIRDIYFAACFFLSKESMIHKKLQKLCYYAQSWFLANYGKPLFPNRFEAWVHGPVSPDLYQKYRYWGWTNIPKIENPPIFDDERVTAILEQVYEEYGRFTADELENMTHKELPWKDARGDCMPQDYSRNPISLIKMREYYGKRIGRTWG